MAMYDKKSVEDLDVAGKRVIVRVDFNVPLDKETGTKITDDKRIKGALPTIKYLVDNNAKVILVSHLGRPKGVKLGAAPSEANAAFTLKPVAEELAKKLGDLKEELFNLRFQHATGQLENPMKIRDVKKSIARIKTIQSVG